MADTKLKTMHTMEILQPPTAKEVQQAVEENNKVLNWIKEWQSKNDYNHIFLDEYNVKFNAEFNHFLNTSSLSQTTIDLFKS